MENWCVKFWVMKRRITRVDAANTLACDLFSLEHQAWATKVQDNLDML
jgi:hypothetical protein